MKYSPEQIQFVKDLKDDGKTLNEIASEFNSKFREQTTYEGVKKLLVRYKDISSEMIIARYKVELDKQSRKNRETTATLNKVSSICVTRDDFIKDFKEVISKTPISMTKPVSFKRKSPCTRSLLLHISDTHIGVNINRTELDNLNEFNATIASRRFAYLFNEAINYKPQHRSETELVVCINGDVIAGVIHALEGGVVPLATQMSIATSIFAQGISNLASSFKKVRVYVLGGNHERGMHKANKGRQTDQKWDNYTTILFVGLRELFKKHKNIDITIPPTPYVRFEVQGHKVFMTHGDTVLNVGNVSKNINVKRIKDDINDIIVGLAEKFSIVLVGHVHKPTYQLLDNGANLLINGTLSGLDSFAQSLGILSNHPCQQMFEVTKDHAVGDLRLIHLKDADDMKELDKIIKPMVDLF